RRGAGSGRRGGGAGRPVRPGRDRRGPDRGARPARGAARTGARAGPRVRLDERRAGDGRGLPGGGSLSGRGDGVMGNREVPRIDIRSPRAALRGARAEAPQGEEGGWGGNPVSPHATEPKAKEAAA